MSVTGGMSIINEMFSNDLWHFDEVIGCFGAVRGGEYVVNVSRRKKMLLFFRKVSF